MLESLQILLGLSLLWLLYVYVGYPVLIGALARLRGRRRPQAAATELPRVTVLTAAYNEVDVIGATIENKLEADYPADRLEMIVISDESEDGTDDVVRGLMERFPERLRLIRQAPRRGKTAGLNLAVPEANGEILIFSDANSIYEPHAIRELVRAFDDPGVGYVTGKMIYTNPDGSVTGDGCTTYMRYENALRAWESDAGSVIGVDGGVDAVRARLYKPMRADELPDFVLPLRVVEQGYRVAYQPEAVLREAALASSSQEYRMRVRVALRAMWALFDLRQLLNPFRDPLFAWQLGSHKLLRYLAFVPQAVALLANAALLPFGLPYQLLFATQLLFYLLAFAGQHAAAARGIPLAGTAYYLCLLNLSCAHATWRFLRGQRQALWQPRGG